MKHHIIVIGGGGHAKVVADALLAAGQRVLGFTSREPDKAAAACGLPVLGDDAILKRHSQGKVRLANGIGGTRGEALRRTVQQRLESEGWTFAQVRHPGCIVSPFATIDDSGQLLAGSIVQAGAWIGRGCIVNTGAIVEHDVVLGEYVHVSPGAVICGDVRIGAQSHVGAGATIRHGLELGEGTVVGAGAVVVRNSAGGRVLVGVPARELEKRK